MTRRALPGILMLKMPRDIRRCPGKHSGFADSWSDITERLPNELNETWQGTVQPLRDRVVFG